MSQVVNRQLNIIIDDSRAASTADRLNAKIQALQKSIEKGNAAGKDMAKAITQLGDTQRQLDQLNDVVAGRIRPSFSMVRREVDALRTELEGMSQDAPEFAARFQRFQTVSAEFERMRISINGAGQSFRGLLDDFKGTAAGVAVGNFIQQGISAIGNSVKNAIGNNAKLSDELADLQRVTGLTADEVANLNDQLQKLDTRTSNSELRGIAVIGGKLGVAKQDLLGFVDATNQLTTALGDELGNADQVTTELGKIINVYDKGAKVTGDRMLEIGNAIVGLANSGVATGGFLVDFTKRLAGVASTANVTLESSLGLAAGFEELGQTSEVSATAVSQLITKIAQDVPKYAKLAGKEVKEFYNTLNNTPTEALLQLAEGLTKNKNGFSEIAGAFKDADAGGARVISTLGVLGQKADFFRGKIKAAGDQLKETSQITDAYRLKNETFGANLEKIGKNISSWFTGTTLAKGLNAVAKAFSDLTAASKSSSDAFDDRKSEFKKLESQIEPLLSKYEELNNKSNRSVTEQTELKKIIGEIGNILPSAVTQFDKYGNAIAISSQKIHDFIERQRRLIEFDNQKEIDKREAQLSEAIKLQDSIEKALNRRNAKGNIIIDETMQSGGSTGFGGGQTLTREATDAEINKIRDQAAQIAITISTLQDKIKTLKGIPLIEVDPDEQKKLDDAQKKAEELIKKQQLTEEQLKKLLHERKELQDELTKIDRGLQLDDLTNFMKKIGEINFKFDDLVKKAKGYKPLISQANDLRSREIENATTDFLQKGFNKIKIPDLIDLDSVDESLNAIGTRLKSASDKIMKQTQDQQMIDGIKAQDAYNEKIYGLQLQALTSSGKKQLEAKKALLEEERKVAIEASRKGSNEIDLINAEFDQKQEDLDRQHLTERLQLVINYASQVANIYSQISQNQITQLENQLSNEQSINEQRKSSYQKQLDQKLISQKQYDQKVLAADQAFKTKQAEIKRKEFEKNQEAAEIQAIISGAQAAVNALATPGVPYPVALAFALAAGVFAAAQIGIIENQDPPSFGKGTGSLLQGPSHQSKHKGMPVKNPETNQTVAYVEGGEGIINKHTMADKNRYSVSGTPSQIASALNSYHGGVNWESGATLQPKWLSTSPLQINIPRVTGSMQKVGWYASGGVFAASTQNAQVSAASNQNNQMIEQNTSVMLMLYNRLNEPIIANVVYGQYEAKATRINEIRNNGMIS
ncbi:phage tail tape measure protein [Chitinophagaceae bacterium 26-R-25]|nr:phage tail tape measure protein [Chitinophagaceae bacterium 26-R-25]